MIDGQESNFAEFEQQVVQGSDGGSQGNDEATKQTETDDKAVSELLDATLGKKPDAEDPPAEASDEGDDGDADDEEGDDADGKKRRSKPEGKRIAELTARLRETERKLEAIIKGDEPKGGDKPQVEAPPERPKAEDFEYGEADPAYVEALTDWKLETRDHERRKAEGEQSNQRAILEKINAGMVKAETDAKAKYQDFDAKIAEAVEARGGAPLPPLLSIGIGVSPVGGDIVYRLATDEATSERVEALAKGGQATSKQFAMALGELEGEYMPDADDGDLDLGDDLDVVRMLGRMRARVKGAKPPAKEPPKVVPTNAPEPPKHSTRGSSGRFEVDGTTTDFAAFERAANKRR